MNVFRKRQKQFHWSERLLPFFSRTQRNSLEKGKITGQCLADLIDHFNAKLKEKWPHLSKKKVLFHHENASAHSSVIADAKLVKYDINCFLIHLTLDLASNNFFPLPNLKKWLRRKRFSSNCEIINAIDAYFEKFKKSYFSERLKLKH